jgi:purine-binding chemotaxis protein CheW
LAYWADRRAGMAACPSFQFEILIHDGVQRVRSATSGAVATAPRPLFDVRLILSRTRHIRLLCCMATNIKMQLEIESGLCANSTTERCDRMNVTDNRVTTDSAGLAPADSRSFLTFCLGREEYGIDLQHVQKLLHYGALTMVYDGPTRIKGVAIADGMILSLVDLRVPADAATPVREHLTAVIILDLPERSIAMLVDDVRDMVTLSAEQIGAVRHADSGLDNRYLIGVAAIGQRKLILLDIDRIMTVAPADAEQDEQDEQMAA